MPIHDFFFALQLSDESSFDSMVADLAGTVLGHVGFPPAAIAEVTSSLRGALSAGVRRGQHKCDVRFRAHSGELKIVVSFPGLSEWHESRPLPPLPPGSHVGNASV